MERRVRALLVVVCLSFTCAAPVAAEVLVWPGTSGGVILTPNSVGAQPTLALSWRPYSFIEPEVLLASGAFAGSNEYAQRIAFGVRGVLPNEGGLRPFTWVAFSHAHETALDAVARHPMASLLGFSEVGVSHRSGAEGGLGLLVPITISRHDGLEQSIDLSLRGTAMYLPDFASFSDVQLADRSRVYLLFEVALGLPIAFNDDALQQARVRR